MGYECLQCGELTNKKPIKCEICQCNKFIKIEIIPMTKKDILYSTSQIYEKGISKIIKSQGH